MIGITMEELYDVLAHNHEVEFTYSGDSYTIEPSSIGGKDSFVLWREHGAITCLNRTARKENEKIQDLITRFLNDKCFDGRSFLEIEKDITVETIF